MTAKNTQFSEWTDKDWKENRKRIQDKTVITVIRIASIDYEVDRLLEIKLELERHLRRGGE